MLHQSSRTCPSAPTRLALSSHTCNRHRPTAALRQHVLAHAQRRRLFGEGGTTPDGSASGSSSSDEDAPPSTAQQPQQQQGAAAAAAEAERQRKRQDALRRIEASTARLRKRSTGSAMVDAALQQMYARELAADAADIVASAPSTLKQQLAQEGADLEADWAEAEAASTGALSTTGRAKTLAALAASKGLPAASVLRPARPMMRPELPFPNSYDDGGDFDDFEDDEDAWQDILEADDLPLWEDSRFAAQQAGKDPVAAAAASIRRQIDDPAFQVWLRQQEQERAAKEARASREAELRSKLQAGASAADRLRRKQEAADLARMQSKLQGSSSSQGIAARPLARPNAPAGSSSTTTTGGWEDDVVLDPNDVKKSDVGLTPAQMAALLEEFGSEEPSNSSSGSSQRLQTPVFTPKQGYSFSGPARAAASRLADAGAAGQLQRPLLVRPSVRPAGTAGGSVLDQQQYWDDDEAEAAAAAAAEAERKALIQSLLADQELQQQQQQQAQQQRRQQAAGPAVDADRVAAAADNLKKAVFNASLKRPGGRPGMAPAQSNQQQPPAAAAAAAAAPQQPGDRFAAAAAALQRPSSRPGQQVQQQNSQQGSETTAWDAEEAAAAAAAQQEADRLALLQQLQAEAEAADLIAFALAASEQQQQQKQPNKTTPKGPASSSSSNAITAKPALQGLNRPSNRPSQQQQPQQQAQARNAASPPPAQPKQRGPQPPQRPKASPAAAAAKPEQQAGQQELWDEEESARAKAAQAEAARRRLLIELAEEFLDAAAADSAGAPASVPEAQAARKAASSSRPQAAAAPAGRSSRKPDALSGLRKPLARPAQQPAPSISAKQQASTKLQQGKQAKQQPDSKRQQVPISKRDSAAAATAEAGEAASTQQHQQAADAAEQVGDTAKGGPRKESRQPQQSANPTASQADRAALKQRLEQAAQALMQPSTPQLQRPARIPAATNASGAAAATAAAPAGKVPLPAQPGSSSSSSRKKERVSVDLQGPRQRQSAEADVAVDWRFRHQQQQPAQAGSGDWRLPRTIPADKLQLAQYLEATRTPTAAVIRGVAARQDRDVSLVLQLEELGCVTLMPVTHLLPSQLSQLCSEAGLSAAQFPTGSLRAGGRVGERATAALQGWKGRRLDVILSTMRQPHYLAGAARERLLAGTPSLKRHSFGFWAHLAATCRYKVRAALPGQDSAACAADLWRDFWQNDTDVHLSSRLDAFKRLPAHVRGRVLQQATSVAADLEECLTDPSTIQRAAAALLGVDADGNLPDDPWTTSMAMKAFDLLLAQLQAEGRLPDAAASMLFEPESSTPDRFARCVAVATWPPAWLDEQQQAEALAGSSGSDSGSVLWVAQREQLHPQQDPQRSERLTYTREQVALWKASQMGVDDRFGMQVVGVHPQGYLLCQFQGWLSGAVATVAVPLSQCPPSLRLSIQQQQDAAAVRSDGAAGGLQLYDEKRQPRWEPWGLQQAAPAAAAAAAGKTSTGSGVDASELQAWRQGALGLWRKPYLSVNVQLLPLEQQQDLVCLQPTAASQEGTAGAEGSVKGSDGLSRLLGFGMDEFLEVVGSEGRGEGFGDSVSLLLLGRIVEQREEEG